MADSDDKGLELLYEELCKEDDKLLEQWYEALYEENCNKVMELLRVDPTLLKEGWDGDPSRTVGGSRLNYWIPRTEGPWMGHTALHVGARRGCTDLLTQVLNLCGVKIQMGSPSLAKEGVRMSEAEEKSSSSNIEMITVGSPDRRSLAESEDRKGKKIAVSPLSQDGEGADRNGRIAGSSSLSQEDLAESEGEGAERKGRIAGSSLSQEDLAESEGEGADRKGEKIAGPPLSEEGEGTDSVGIAQADSQRLPIDSKPTANSSIQRVLSRRILEAPSTLKRALSRSPSKGKVQDKKRVRAPSGASSGRKVLEAPSTLKRALSRSPSKGKVDDKKLVRAASGASPGRKVRLDDRGPGRPGALSGTHSKCEVDDTISEPTAGVSVSLENLLIAKDGEYKLDAIGMAAVNGNVDVLTILLSASLGCKPIVERYNIRDVRFQSGITEDGMREVLREVRITRRMVEDEEKERKKKREEHALRRKELVKVTEQVIDTFSRDPVFGEGILGLYEKHRDFNFLPRDVYLFHFLQIDLDVTETLTWPRDQIDRTRTKVQDAILDKVSQSSPELACFLWELQDGQGRPPLHIAVDEDKDEGTLHGVRGPADEGTFHVAGLLHNLHIRPICKLLWEVVSRTRKTPGEGRTFKKIINAADGGGRTAMHRAVALGRAGAFSVLITRPTMRGENLEDGELLQHQQSRWDSLRSRCGFYLDINKLSKVNDFLGNEVSEGEHSTLLETMIIHKRGQFLEGLSNRLDLFKDFVNKLLLAPCPMYVPQLGLDVRFDCLELAVMVGHEPIIAALWQHIRREEDYIKRHEDNIRADPFAWVFRVGSDVNYDLKLGGDVLLSKKKLFNHFGFLGDHGNMGRHRFTALHLAAHRFTALHLAAARGKYDILKLLTDHEHCDPNFEDIDGNTALHHATKGSVVEFHPCLFDYVNCQQILDTQRDREKNTKECLQRRHLESDEFIVDREGCIDLLLQLGCNIFKTNKYKQAPYPGPHLNAKFRSWWLDKQTKEFGVEQNILTTAANAISITGTLVATASYVGPLQPPLGYSEDPSQLQLQIVWVKLFIVFDTMSFYLAISAVILSLIPSLPMPDQSMIVERRRTRKMVTLATMVLLPSIIFVVIAFASSSIAVIQTNRSTWNYGGLTIGTASVGGLVCLGAIALFFIRMIGFIWHKNTRIKKLYELTSF